MVSPILSMKNKALKADFNSLCMVPVQAVQAAGWFDTDLGFKITKPFEG